MKALKYLALATLVTVGACSSSKKSTPPVTGTISGTVSIEGTGTSGVTVTLSSGATATTDGSGHYTFSDVSAGSYTVTISGFPSDATFSASAKAATITTTGQVVTVDFDGSYIRTSAIIGSVKDGDGNGLSGVTVSISGQGSQATKNTDNTGSTEPFTGLRAGAYTVTISGYDATNYTCASTSQSVTLATGELQVVAFTCTVKTTAGITGSLFLDEASPQDGVFEPNLEKKLAVAGVPIQLEGAVNDTMTVLTDANGDFSFSNLAAGSYRVTYQGTAADVPGNVMMSGNTQQTVTVTTGAVASANFPFVITQQTIKVYAYLGGDVAPIPGWKMDLYDTQANAQAGGSTGKLTATVTTDSMGEAAFRFMRSADTGPNGTGADQIVFARAQGAPTLYTLTSTSSIIEIHYTASDSIGFAPDTLAALYNQVVVKAHAAEIDSDTLANWQVNMFANKDSTSTQRQTATTNSDGDVFYTVNRSFLNSLASDHALPDTLWVRLAGTQAGANGHGFKEAPSATDGMAMGQYLMFIWDGTVLPSDTIDIGSEMVSYTDADLSFAVHHEADDSTDVPTFTGGDDLSHAPQVQVELDTAKTAGGQVVVAGPTAAAGGTGLVTFAGMKTGKAYIVHARSTSSSVAVLNDTMLTVTPDGSDQTYMDSTLAGSAGASSFAYKFNNVGINGTIKSVDGVTPVAGMRVMIQATPDNIQPNKMGTDSTVVKTRTTGYFTMSGMREGPYMVSVEDSTGVWSYLTTLTTSTTPTSGTADNTDAHTGMRDIEGLGTNQVVNFQAYRMDTKIEGLVFNDRDLDNTQDPSDALSGAVLQLYMDNSGAVTRDTLVATDTSDANGAYSFTGLREGQYMVAWVNNTPNTDNRVLRALKQDTVIVTPTAAANVGTTTPTTLPEWDYSTTTYSVAGPADFLFLAENTIAKGIVKDGGTGDGIAGMTISLRRCNASAGPTKPPAAGTCTTYLGTTLTTVSDSTGAFEFDNLEEGVYEISPNPGTVGTYTTSAPASALYLQKNPADVETLTFSIS